LSRGDPFANSEELLRRVYAYVAYRVGNAADAEDITSEAFERALRYRDSYDERRGDAVGWLLGIARNCMYDVRLRTRPHAEGEEAGTFDLEEHVVTRISLAQALATLSDRDRDLIALRYGGDLKPREIASLLDQRVNAVEVALTRARTRLAAALSEAESPPTERSTPLPVYDIRDQAL